jgi:hypothetical protein
MEPLRDDQLIADLRALRPTPRPPFAAELDERAAAGFPRRSRLRPPSFARLRAVRPRQVLIPAGGVAVAAIAIATAVLVSNGHEKHLNAHFAARPGGESAPLSKRAGGVEFEAEVEMSPNAASAPAAGSSASTGSAETLSGFNASLRHRAVERSAEIILGAAPEDVAGDAARVFAAVHANDGIVMRSSTREARVGEASASFELLIPSAKLGNALAAFSAIDEVRSRHDATADITHATVSAAELLRESRARVDSLLSQLEGAETESEREAIEAELRHERRHASRLAAQIDQLHRRAEFSRVYLRIESGDPGESSGGGSWGIDDAFHDAGHILAVAAAVAVIGLAILGPIALVAFLAWLTHRAWVRRERRRALG